MIFSKSFLEGKYVVGCTDIMVGSNTEDGCFLRLYYPSQLNDAYVSIKTLKTHMLLTLSNLLITLPNTVGTLFQMGQLATQLQVRRGLYYSSWNDPFFWEKADFLGFW